MINDNDDSGTMECPNGHKFNFDCHTEEGTWFDGKSLRPCCTVCDAKAEVLRAAQYKLCWHCNKKFRGNKKYPQVINGGHTVYVHKQCYKG